MKTATRHAKTECAVSRKTVGTPGPAAPGQAFPVAASPQPMDPPMRTDQTATSIRPTPAPNALEGLLDSTREFVGAAAAWVGAAGPDGRLSFPVRRGAVPENWLRLQQGLGGAWGFVVREGPCLMNESPAVPLPGEGAPANVLTCPLPGREASSGYVALADKPGGFTSHDAAVLQGFAHHLAKALAAASPGRAWALPNAVRLALENAADGVVVTDEGGCLVLVNARWCEWCGFAKEELLGRTAPFPFWVGHRELTAVTCPAESAAGGEPDRTGDFPCLPFRRRDGIVFWCRVRTVAEEIEGRRVLFSFLSRVSPQTRSDTALPAPGPRAAGPFPDWQQLADGFALPAVLASAGGRVLWANPACETLLSGKAGLVGQALRDRFEAVSAALLHRLFQDPVSREPGRMGRLFLRPHGSDCGEQDVTAHWLGVPLADGPGFLLTFPEGDDPPDGPDDLTGRWPRTLLYPAADWAVLLVRPGGALEGWDERWEELTGLTKGDVSGVPGEVLLDWLFPQQRDRELVADLLHQPARRGLQAVLEVVSRAGSRPVLCTFLPTGPQDERGWLLLAGDAGPAATTAARRYLRQFTRGLSHLLNHYLTTPIGLSEMALDRLLGSPASSPVPPAEAGAWFSQILESCMGASQLVDALQTLAAPSPGETQQLPFAGLVREFLDDWHSGGRRDYAFTMELRDAETVVRVNRRMMCVVLGHLLRNAEHALATSPQKRIEVRVSATADEVCCEVEDTGEGLPTDDWTALLAPFSSTKGPFARDAAHARQEATGLGLTVSQHLLTLHGGRLELRRNVAGTTAVMVLPRVRTEPAAPGLPAGPFSVGERVGDGR